MARKKTWGPKALWIAAAAVAALMAGPGPAVADNGLAKHMTPRAQALIDARPWDKMKEASVVAKTCHYYENRARFRERGAGDFLVFLSNACEVARSAMRAGSEAAPAAAEFLTRLVAFRETIMAMNRERVFGRTSDPRAKPLQATGEFVPIGQVSETGEFLIAHRMGLLRAFDLWAARTPDVTAEVTEKAWR